MEKHQKGKCNYECGEKHGSHTELGSDERKHSWIGIALVKLVAGIYAGLSAVTANSARAFQASGV